MKEIVNILGRKYLAEVSTRIDSISFSTSEITIEDVQKELRYATELSVSDENEESVYGIYNNLVFNSATFKPDKNVVVNFHIGTTLEERISAIEEDQAIQDGAIEELANIIGGAE